MALALVATASGGFVGTMLRDVLTGLEHLPSPHGGVSWLRVVPWVLLGINFVGVFVATRLLRGPLRHHDPNDVTRLLVVTGFFGGLTSYSGLFVDLAVIWHLSKMAAVGVAVFAVLSGALAAGLGLLRWPR